MSYKFLIKKQIQQQILDDYGPETRKMLRNFLQTLANDTEVVLSQWATRVGRGRYCYRMRNGLYVGWTLRREIDIETGEETALIVILGVGHTSSAALARLREI